MEYSPIMWIVQMIHAHVFAKNMLSFSIQKGKPMDKIQYKKEIKACALDKDIKSFSHEDTIENGERGFNMSGRKKQRIQLARVVYNDADIYIFDNPFNAVDAHTTSTLFNVKNQHVIKF